MPSYQEFIEHALATRGNADPVFRYNDKMAGRELAELSGVRAPALLQGPGSLKNTLIPPEAPAVVKPVHGSSGLGVFPLIPQGGGVKNLFTGKLMAWSQVVEAGIAAKHTPANQRLIEAVHPDAVRNPWIVEELLVRRGQGGAKSLPYDWKAFTFGGKVEAIWQSTRTPHATRIKWYDRDWKPIGDIAPSPKWEYNGRLPKPKNPGAMIAAFEAVAAHVASPFIRVDLFEDQGGEPVFSEITPHPTGGRARFNAEWDARFGQAWADAL